MQTTLGRRIALFIVFLSCFIPPAFAQDESKTETLVKQLGDSQYSVREAAQKQLRSLGLDALSALKKALKSSDTEVARSSKNIIHQIYQDCEPRLWKRWSSLVGEDNASRELFSEMLLVTDAVETLARFTDSPALVAAGYPQAMQRLHDLAATRTYISPQERRSLSSCYSLGESIYGIYLGTFAGTQSIKARPLRTGEEVNPEKEVLETMLRIPWLTRGPWDAEAIARGQFQQGNLTLVKPARKLAVASLLNLKNPHTMERFFRSSDSHLDAKVDTEIVLPLARLACREKSFPVLTRAASWPFLAEAGLTEYLPDMKELQNDKTRVQQFWRADENRREYNVLVSDISVACQLLMHQQKLKDFGFFEHLNSSNKRIDTSCFAFGFPSEASRQAAYSKAAIYLNSMKKE
ncbi:MAG: hypothetical protein QM703_27620 [Gemmatales bacterium]